MAHGYLRVTRDLDLIVALDGENPKRALMVFESLAYRPNVPVELMDFADRDKRKAWIQEKGMQVFQIVSEELFDCPVDLFVDEPIDFEKMYALRVEYALSDQLKIPVVSLAHLRELKVAAGRPRDLLDVEELDQIGSNNG